MSVRNKPLITAEQHQSLLSSLQCWESRVKQSFGADAVPEGSVWLCNQQVAGEKCFNLLRASPKNNNLWEVSASYNDRTYILKVNAASIQMFLQEGDQAIEQFSFTPTGGVQYSSDDMVKALSLGLWHYFEDMLTKDACKTQK